LRLQLIKITAFLFLLFLGTSTDARHIIGGDISYTCNGDNNSYTFTLKVYRDCLSGGAEFDDPAIVTIYRGNRPPFTTIENRGVPLSSVTEIAADDNPCFEVPPNICVEEGIYIFTIPLPVSTESYHVVYQRCCRNNTITNIINPGSKGATYSIELTPAAQNVCNNSPVFNDFPPIVICANQPLDYDHSASDPEGDQLVYEFCTPLLGGGLLGTADNPGDATSCQGVAPNPACPPPFGFVSYVLPTYSANAPLAGNPTVSIDPSTGVISGVPEILGQFVVGVCVREIRGGVLMSVIRRDFQFNVADCEPTVDARIRSDEIIGVKEFVVNSCGNETVTFGNQSVQRSNITTFRWEFDVNGTTETFSDWEPTVTFPGVGTYQGNLFLNPGSDCGDTATIFVNVYPDINADFSFDYDTCVAGPVSFTDLSFSNAGPIQTWAWTFGDGNISSEVNPVHLFTDPGNQQVTLTVTDENECTDRILQEVPWFPAPPIILIQPTTFNGCAPQFVFFNNLSTPIDTTYDIIWNFGDGTTGTDISPTHLYEQEGVYDVSVEITSPIGCFISRSWNNWITVRPSPIADFTFTPDMPTSFLPEVSFFDESVDAANWLWLFDTDGTSREINPVFSFPDTGQQVVSLIVTHESGCKDTLTQLIDVIPKVSYFLPNAFTPNSDELNDLFMGTGIYEGLRSFQMTIWSRWGELIFQTNNPNEGWNGRKNNVGKQAPGGVYVYVVNYVGPRGEAIELKGFATLLK